MTELEYQLSTALENMAAQQQKEYQQISNRLNQLEKELAACKGLQTESETILQALESLLKNVQVLLSR